MQITYISHAGYLIESRSRKSRILLDPWLEGSTYMDQCWLAWSYPGPIDELLSSDILLFTHYHKDHFHPPSLSRMSKDCEVVVPTTAGSFFRDWARQTGFAKVREIGPGHSFRLGDFEIHSVRIADHWEFLDETAYLIVDGDQAALFLADLWYLPEAVVRSACAGFHVCFAAVTWGGELQDLFVLPDGFRLDSLEEYYRYGWDEATLSRKNAINEYTPYLHLAKHLKADCLVPGSLSFGWIHPNEDRVKPLPMCRWLGQEQYIENLPDPELRGKSHPMYPGDRFDPERGFYRANGSSRPNTPVTQAMRCLANSRKGTGIELDGEAVSARFLDKISARIAELRDASSLYGDPLSGILQASRQIEFQIVNEARQVFLFEQDGARYRMREIDAPSGARDIVFIPPSVMTALVTEWGPCWTEAEMCTLVKVSATGWEPYLILKQLFR